MLKGFDYLGGVKFEKAMLSAHRRGLCAGIFLRTFGDARKTLENMCKRGTFSEIVVHLAPFDNTHSYPVQRLLPSVLADAKYCGAVQKRNPGTKILLSPFCEHNHPAKVMATVFNKLKAVAPSCLMVNSVWKGQQVPGVITEIHLESAKLKAKPKGEYIVSFDGFGGDGSGDFTDSDFDKIAAFYADARQIRGWAFRCNGKFGHKDTTPLSQRKCWPSKEYLQGQLAVMDSREGSITYPKDALLKPFSDDHGQGGKDNKLMVICKKKASSLKVFDSKGTVIDTLTRVLPDYNGDGPMKNYARYYSSKYAFQVANIAKKNTGSYLIKVDTLPLTDGRKRSSFR